MRGLFSWGESMQVAAAADGGGGGRMWLVNQPANTGFAEVLAIIWRTQLNSALVAPTGPRFNVDRGSTTTAATAAARPMNSNDQQINASCRAVVANTGLTQTINQGVTTFFPTASATAVSYVAPGSDVWVPPMTSILRPGEFLLVRQVDAGTAADDRRVYLEIHWREVDSIEQCWRTNFRGVG